jgi:hypothetical protein
MGDSIPAEVVSAEIDELRTVCAELGQTLNELLDDVERLFAWRVQRACEDAARPD